MFVVALIALLVLGVIEIVGRGGRVPIVVTDGTSGLDNASGLDRVSGMDNDVTQSGRELENGDVMRSIKQASVPVVALIALAMAAIGCSSDDDTVSSDETVSSTTSRPATEGSTDATVNPEYETWCTSLQNLIDQSSPADLSVLADLAAFTEAVQSLATTAPEPIQSQMQTLATASELRLEAARQDPTATLAADVSQGAQAATADISVFVEENCGGVDLPTIDL